MCATCGCSGNGVRITGPAAQGDSDHQFHGHGHGHEHSHEHGHGHGHENSYGNGHEHQRGAGHVPQQGGAPHPENTPQSVRKPTARSRTIALEQQVLAKNDRLAERNRRWMADRGIVALNLMSSPGSGKTTLLERTLHEFGEHSPMGVLEGDQETLLDADRIRATGVPVVQVNTGSGCHLDAEMMARGLHSLQPDSGAVVVIENVGNLVCPALFDLGEQARVVLASVTEGEDKPLKYPNMFRTADLVLLNKVDLLPHLDFDVEAFVANCRSVAVDAEVLDVSARTGENLPAWYEWLRRCSSVSLSAPR